MKNFFDFSFSAFMGVMSTLPYCLPFTEDVTGSFRYVLSATQCGNLAIFLPIRFYVKLILQILEALNFDFQSISALKKCKNSLKPNFRGAKTVKMAEFETSQPQIFISRKI